MVYDGAPSDRLYGCDLEYGFIDLGYELFADRDTLRTHFFTANILEENGSLNNKEGKFDFIYIGSFLHLFSREDQTAACKRIAKLLKPHSSSKVFGRQLGNVKAREVCWDGEGGMMWQQDPQSFEEMWQTVGEDTGTRWKVIAELDEGEAMDKLHWSGSGCRRLKFEVTRLT